MRVDVQSRLPCNPALAWQAVQTLNLLQEVCTPLAQILPERGGQLPLVWSEGETVRCRMKLFGFFPVGSRTLHFERIDQHTRQIQTRESDPLVRSWDHLISLSDTSDGHCLYRDEVEVHAGLLTPLVWLFAQCLYRHRHRRWQRVARRLEDSARPAPGIVADAASAG
jgi:hypothetical protein